MDLYRKDSREVKICSIELCFVHERSEKNLHSTLLFLSNRALVDCNTKLGKEFILSCFPYEEDKVKALRILATVRSYKQTLNIYFEEASSTYPIQCSSFNLDAIRPKTEFSLSYAM